MALITTDSLQNEDPGRTVLLTGQFNTIFNNLSLNLPARFYAYAQPSETNQAMHDAYLQLESSKVKFNHQDAWEFNTFMKIVTPGMAQIDPMRAIDLLVKSFKIPEKHLYFEHNKIPTGQLFPQTQIYLSRYAAAKITKRLMHGNNSFENDIEQSLFVHQDAPKQSNHNILAEIKLAFSGYYFILQFSEFDEIKSTTWAWVRGIKLKKASASKMNDLEYIFGKFNPDMLKGKGNVKVFKFQFEKFKQEFIFDVLFKDRDNGTFKDQYENALRKFSYKINLETNGWHRGKKIAPQYPGAFFAPHIELFLSWAIHNFCEFIKSEEQNCTTKTKSNWLQNTAKKFFAAIKQGVMADIVDQKSPTNNIWGIERFINQHHSDARKIIEPIKNGSGRNKTNKITGKTAREFPNGINYLSTLPPLFEDYNYVKKQREFIENKLIRLHDEYKEKPSQEILDLIIQAEKELLFENVGMHGFNFQGFSNVHELLSNDGTFIPRPIIGPARINENIFIQKTPGFAPDDADIINTATGIGLDVGQLALPFRTQDAAFEKLRNNLQKYPPVSKFSIAPKTIIPKGAYYKRGTYTNTKGKLIEYAIHDQNGGFESVNSLVDSDLILNRHGKPRLVHENFQYSNFLFESDTLNKADQLLLAQKLIDAGLVNRVTYSGGKSLHMRITVKDAPTNPEEYKWLFLHIAEKYGLLEKVYHVLKKKFDYCGLIDSACAINIGANPATGCDASVQRQMAKTNIITSKRCNH